MGLTPYSSETFFALLDVNMAVSVASIVDDRVARCRPFYTHIPRVLYQIASQEQIIIYFCRCHYF